MKKCFSNQISYWLGVIAIGLILGISIQFAGAWVEPSENPPSPNIGAPVNTGSNAQIKTGGLGIGGPLNPGAFKVYGSGSLGIFEGSVGIGTTSPIGKLDVNGITYLRNYVNITGNLDVLGGNGISIPYGWVRSGSTSSNYFMGNVGIGTASPTALLHVKDPNYDQFTVRIQSGTFNSSNRWGGIGFSGEDYNTKGAIIFQSIGDSYSRGKMIFALNNNQNQTNASPSNAVMTLLPTGNVGIGTASPTQKLDVSGYAMASTGFCIGSNCITSWPSGGDNLGNHIATTTLNMNGQSITNANALYGSIFYDRDNTNYYVNPDGVSTFLDIRPSIIYDRDNTGYYVNPNGMSNMERVDFSYGYDRNDTAYYIDLNNTSKFYAINLGGVTRTTWPSSSTSLWTDRGTYIDYISGSSIYRVGTFASANTMTVETNSGGTTKSATIGTTTDGFGLGTISGQYAFNVFNASSLGGYIRVYNSSQNITLDECNTSTCITRMQVSATGVYVAKNLTVSGNFSTTGTATVAALSTSGSISSSRGNIIGVGMYANIFYDNDSYDYYVDPSSTSRFNTITYYNQSPLSDIRLKKDIRKLDNSLDRILKLDGVSFKWKDESKGTGNNLGMIAQEVEKFFPEVVTTDPETGLKGVQYQNLVAPIIEAIKELTSKMNDLFDKYLDQQKQIDELKMEIEALKK